MIASVSMLIRAVTDPTLFTQLKSCKHSKTSTFNLTFVSKNLRFSNKWVRMPNKIIMTPRKSVWNEGIATLKQCDGSFEFHPHTSAAGLESTLNHLSKWILIGLFYIVLLSRHDSKALWIALGANLNGGLSIILKKTIKQERPLSTSKSDFGMPSTHAQSIFFIVFMANLSIIELLGMNVYTATIVGILLALGSYFSWLRVSQHYHTVDQVMTGATLGSIFSVFWFWLWDAIVVKAFHSYLWIRLVLGFTGIGTSLCLTIHCFQSSKK